MPTATIPISGNKIFIEFSNAITRLPNSGFSIIANDGVVQAIGFDSDGATLIINIAPRVTKFQRLTVSYDGLGDLKTSTSVDAFSVSVQNQSEYSGILDFSNAYFAYARINLVKEDIPTTVDCIETEDDLFAFLPYLEQLPDSGDCDEVKAKQEVIADLYNTTRNCLIDKIEDDCDPSSESSLSSGSSSSKSSSSFSSRSSSPSTNSSLSSLSSESSSPSSSKSSSSLSSLTSLSSSSQSSISVDSISSSSISRSLSSSNSTSSESTKSSSTSASALSESTSSSTSISSASLLSSISSQSTQSLSSVSSLSFSSASSNSFVSSASSLLSSESDSSSSISSMSSSSISTSSESINFSSESSSSISTSSTATSLTSRSSVSSASSSSESINFSSLSSFSSSESSSSSVEQLGDEPPGSNDLAAWYRPETLSSYTNGQNVTSWPDSSPSDSPAEIHVMDDDGPVYKTNQFPSGKPALDFDSNRLLADFHTNWESSNGEYTLAILYSVDTFTTSSRVMTTLTNAYSSNHWNSIELGIHNRDISGSDVVQGSANGDSTKLCEAGILDTTWYFSLIETIDNSDPTLIMFLNEVQIDSKNPGTPGVAQSDWKILIGGKNSFGDHDGKIAEVLFYNRRLSEGEKEDLWKYIEDKYGINL